VSKYLLCGKRVKTIDNAKPVAKENFSEIDPTNLLCISISGQDYISGLMLHCLLIVYQRDLGRSDSHTTA
jgi:hypothetical protein